MKLLDKIKDILRPATLRERIKHELIVEEQELALTLSGLEALDFQRAVSVAKIKAMKEWLSPNHIPRTYYE